MSSAFDALDALDLDSVVDVTPEVVPVLVTVATPVVGEVVVGSPKRTVGRPKGSVRKGKVTDSTKIRNILNQYGVTYPAKKVIAVLRTRRVDVTKAGLAVQISQVRSKMITEQTGIKNRKAGRPTLRKLARISKRLAS